jgi:hypothetical protein
MLPTKIDHVALGLERLITQWQDKPNVVGLLRSFLEQVNTLEDSLFQVLYERGIYEAIGVQLDNIGQLFGVSRLGRNDDDYRAAILLKISQLNDDGTTEVFMQALRTVGNTNAVDFWEHLSGDVHAYMGTGVSIKTYSQLEDAVPAGVNVTIITDDMGDSFLPSELTPLASDLQTGLLEDLQVFADGVASDLQVQSLNTTVSPRAYLPEIEDLTTINPLSDIINKDSFFFTGEIIFENGDYMIDQDGKKLLWTDLAFNN